MYLIFVADPVFHVRFDVAQPVPLHKELNFSYQETTKDKSRYQERQRVTFSSHIESTHEKYATCMENSSEKIPAKTAKIKNTLIKVQTHGFPAQKIFLKKSITKENINLLKCSFCKKLKSNSADPRLSNNKYKYKLRSICAVCFRLIVNRSFTSDISSASCNLKINDLNKSTSDLTLKKNKKNNTSIVNTCKDLKKTARNEDHQEKSLCDPNNRTFEMACDSSNNNAVFAAVEHGVSGTSMSSLNHLRGSFFERKIREKFSSVNQPYSLNKKSNQKQNKLLEHVPFSHNISCSKNKLKVVPTTKFINDASKKREHKKLKKKTNDRSRAYCQSRVKSAANFSFTSSCRRRITSKSRFSANIHSLIDPKAAVKRNCYELFAAKRKKADVVKKSHHSTAKIKEFNKKKIENVAAENPAINNVPEKLSNSTNHGINQSSDSNNQRKWDADISDISDDNEFFLREETPISSQKQLMEVSTTTDSTSVIASAFDVSSASIKTTQDNVFLNDSSLVKQPKVKENSVMRSCLEFLETKSHQHSGNDSEKEKLQIMPGNIKIVSPVTSVCNGKSLSKKEYTNKVIQSKTYNSSFVDWFEDDLPILTAKAAKSKQLNKTSNVKKLKKCENRDVFELSSSTFSNHLENLTSNVTECNATSTLPGNSAFVNYSYNQADCVSKNFPQLTSLSKINDLKKITVNSSSNQSTKTVNSNDLKSQAPRNTLAHVENINIITTDTATSLHSPHISCSFSPVEDVNKISSCKLNTDDLNKIEHKKSLTVKDISSNTTSCGDIIFSDEFADKSQCIKDNKLNNSLCNSNLTSEKIYMHSLSENFQKAVDFNKDNDTNKLKTQKFMHKNIAYSWPFSYPSIDEIEAMSDCSSIDNELDMEVAVCLEELERSGYVPKCFLHVSFYLIRKNKHNFSFCYRTKIYCFCLFWNLI